MKLIRTALLILVSFVLFLALKSNGAEAGNAKATASWISAISVAPVGALKTAEINGESQWGAGVDVGLTLNKFVSLHVVNLAYESDNEWRGGTVDETAVNVEAKLSKFSTESFSPYFIGGGVRSWEHEDWGFTAGLGVKLQFTKNFSLGGDYSLRAWFDGPEDSLARGYLQLTF